MKAIVAVDEHWGIGKDGKLLAHLPGDLRYFREKTLGKTIIVGRKTLETFPGGKPLPGRDNIVLTENDAYCKEGCCICRGLDELFDRIAGLDGNDVFVVGGAEIYELFFPYYDEIFVTRILGSFDADRHFPDLSARPDFRRTWCSETMEEQGVAYRFETYERQ